MKSEEITILKSWRGSYAKSEITFGGGYFTVVSDRLLAPLIWLLVCRTAVVSTLDHRPRRQRLPVTGTSPFIRTAPDNL